MTSKNQRRTFWFGLSAASAGFAIYLAFIGVVVVGALFYLGYTLGQQGAAVENCTKTGTVAVEKAGGGYVCVEEAP